MINCDDFGHIMVPIPQSLGSVAHPVLFIIVDTDKLLVLCVKISEMVEHQFLSLQMLLHVVSVSTGSSFGMLVF